MERKQELTKLINVLRRTARLAGQAQWTDADADTAARAVEQYNRVRARLAELDPGVETLFDALPAGTSLGAAALACRQLAAYYEDEVEACGSGWGGAYGAAWDPESFKAFWQKSAGEIEDLGEYIRESVEDWAGKRRGRRPRREEGGEEPKAE